MKLDILKNKTTFERNDLLLSYNSFGELRVVDLTCEYSVNCSNEKLAIIYLDEFDIKESDFDNMNEVDTYQHFLRILSNTTTSEETRSVITTKDKDLLISGGLIDEGLSITKMSVDDF